MLFYSLKFGGTFFNGISKYILVSISLINIIGGVMIGFVRISNVKEINSEKDNSSKEEIVSCERNVKEINSEKDNNIIEVANDNEAKEPKHVITAEISIEVTGEDEPTKYDKRRLYRYCPWMRGMATSQISCNNGIDKKASHVPL